MLAINQIASQKWP